MTARPRKTCFAMSIAHDGYVFVSDCVNGSALEALRAEADHLFRLKKQQDDTLSEDEYFDKGCALDFFTNRGLPEDDEARLSEEAYTSRRNVRRTRSLRRKDAKPAEGRRDAEDNGSGGGLSDDSEADTWDDSHVFTVREVVFGKLAGLAWDALRSSYKTESKNKQDRPAWKRHKAADKMVVGIDYGAMFVAGDYEEEEEEEEEEGDRCPLLFNEQYVVKPPHSSIEFGWHTDEREQLAMCVFPPGVRPPVYVSVWLALDDCDAANGCLEVLPQALNKPRTKIPGDDDEASVLCLPSNAGDAVVFLSKSGPNSTANPRRVFYAQYSTDVIRATSSDPRPLNLAIPCRFVAPTPFNAEGEGCTTTGK